MELAKVQQAFRDIPELEEPAPPQAGEVTDVLSAAAEFAKLLRKLGVQQTREARELLSTLQEPLGQVEQAREAWQREQQRATESERQLHALAEVVIGTLDLLERMLEAFLAADGMEDWARQTRHALDLCLHNAAKIGLVPLGNPGETFDAKFHDLTRVVPERHRGPVRIGSVVIRGYALHGHVLRRAAVDFES